MSSKAELIIYFLVGLLFTLAIPALAPSIKLFYFIPFLIRCYYRKSLNTCLFIALMTGLLMDLLSAHSRFGLYSANYVITTYFLYPQKRNFFEDSFTTLPFMTFFFSVLSTVVQVVLMILLDNHTINRSLSFLFVDFLLMPFFDAVYAGLVFALPAFIFGKPIRKGSDYFLSKEDR